MPQEVSQLTVKMTLRDQTNKSGARRAIIFNHENV